MLAQWGDYWVNPEFGSGLGLEPWDYSGPAIGGGTMEIGIPSGETFWGQVVQAGSDFASSMLSSGQGNVQQSPNQQATAIVDYAERQMKQNLADYQGGKKAQSDALAFFDQWWQWMVQNLSKPSLGDSGTRAIQERSRGGRWDYFSYYRDPISGTQGVGGPSTSGTSSSAVVTQPTETFLSKYALYLVILLIAIVLFWKFVR